MNPIGVMAVQAMVAPVVLITAAAILSGGLLTIYGSVNDRMRAMDHERLEILTGDDGTLLSAEQVPPSGWPGWCPPRDRSSSRPTRSTTKCSAPYRSGLDRGFPGSVVGGQREPERGSAAARPSKPLIYKL
jgi:hypothetical protein